jgi:MATE family multidrug resistance protein
MTKSPRRERLGREARATARLALPLVAAQVLAMGMGVIDTLLAGNLGTDVLAAVTIGTQIWVLAMLLVFGLLLALTPITAQFDGAGRRDAVGEVFRQGLWLALAIGLVLGVGLNAAIPLLGWIGVDPAIVPEAARLVAAISWGVPALALSVACAKLSDGLSLTKPSMYFNGLALAILLPVAWVLMYGKLGFPRLGAAGAGYAHAIALWIQALAFLAYVARRERYREARLFTRFDWPDFRMQGNLLEVGAPMAVALFMEGSLFVIVALLVGRLGEIPTGAHAIALNVASLTFMLPLGVALATTVRVGNAVGRRDPSGIAWAAIGGLALVLATQAFSVTLMVVLPRPIAGLYSDDQAVISLAVTLLVFAAIFQFSDGIQTLAAGALRGLNDTAVPALITIVAYWGVGLPVSWWLGFEAGLGAPGLWVGLIAGLSAAALLLATRFVRRTRHFIAHGIPESMIASAPPPLVER